jgi:hypothetical protein
MIKRNIIIIKILAFIFLIFIQNKILSQRILWHGEFTYENSWNRIVSKDSLLNNWYNNINNYNNDYSFPEKISLKTEMTLWNINDSTIAFAFVLKNIKNSPSIFYRNIIIDEIYEPQSATVFFTVKNSSNQMITSCNSKLTNKLGYYYSDTCFQKIRFSEAASYFSLDSINLYVDKNLINKFEYYKKLINIYYEFNNFYEKSLNFIDTLQLDKPRLLLFHKFDLEDIDNKIKDIERLHLIEELKLYENDPIDFINKYNILKGKLSQKQLDLNNKIKIIDTLLIAEANKFFNENKKQESIENINYALQYNPTSLIAWNAYIKYYLKNNSIDSALIKTKEFLNKFNDINYTILPQYMQNTIDDLWNNSFELVDYLFSREEYNNAIEILEQLKIINESLEYNKEKQLDIYLTKNYYKLFENFITIYEKSIEKGFSNIALHILLEAEKFAQKNIKYLSVNDIIEKKKNDFLQTLSKSFEDLLLREAWDDAVEQLIILDTLYRNPIFAEDSVLLINYKNKNINKLTENIISRCNNYKIDTDRKKIKKAYQTLDKVINEFNINVQDYKISNCQLKYQNVILKELISKYERKDIIGTKRHNNIKITYSVPSITDAKELLYLSELTLNKLPDTLEILSKSIICNHLEKIVNLDDISLSEDSFRYLYSLANCPQFIFDKYIKKINADTCKEIKNKFNKELSISYYYYNLDSLYQAKNHLIKAKNIWLNTLCEIDPLDLINLEKSIEQQINFKQTLNNWHGMYKIATDSIYIEYQKLKFQYNALPDSIKNKINLSGNRIIFFSTMQNDSLIKLSNLLVNGGYLDESLETIKILRKRGYNQRYTRDIQNKLGEAYAVRDIKDGKDGDYTIYVSNEDYYKTFIKKYKSRIKKDSKKVEPEGVEPSSKQSAK